MNVAFFAYIDLARLPLLCVACICLFLLVSSTFDMFRPYIACLLSLSILLLLAYLFCVYFVFVVLFSPPLTTARTFSKTSTKRYPTT